MAIKLQELQSRSAIVNDDGTPSQYFLNYLRERGGNLTTIDADVIALGTEVDALAAQLAGKVDKTQQVIAGTGLTGGGALTGDVTLNASAQAVLDQITTTRGAVIYRGASGWQALPPGTSGDALKTNGAGADPSWGPVASTGSISLLNAKAFRNAAYNTTAAGWQNLPLDAESWDIGSFFDPVTGRFTPTSPGYYTVNARARVSTASLGAVAIAKNGALEVVVGGDNGGAMQGTGGTAQVYCNGTTDYLTLSVFTGSSRAVTTGSLDTYMEVLGPFA